MNHNHLLQICIKTRKSVLLFYKRESLIFVSEFCQVPNMFTKYYFDNQETENTNSSSVNNPVSKKKFNCNHIKHLAWQEFDSVSKIKCSWLLNNKGRFSNVYLNAIIPCKLYTILKFEHIVHFQNKVKYIVIFFYSLKIN